MKLTDPIHVCCALIEDSSESIPMLWAAQKPGDSHLAGLWEFPGGKIEPGESGEQAIIREIREELGIDIAISGKLPPVDHDYATHCIRLFPFICRITTSLELPKPVEHTALALLTLPRFEEIRLAPADIPVFLAYKENKARLAQP